MSLLERVVSSQLNSLLYPVQCHGRVGACKWHSLGYTMHRIPSENIVDTNDYKWGVLKLEEQPEMAQRVNQQLNYISISPIYRNN